VFHFLGLLADLIAHFDHSDQIEGVEEEDPGKKKKKSDGKLILKVPWNGMDIEIFNLLDHDEVKLSTCVNESLSSMCNFQQWNVI
jgi:hypothetical protein